MHEDRVMTTLDDPTLDRMLGDFAAATEATEDAKQRAKGEPDMVGEVRTCEFEEHELGMLIARRLLELRGGG